MDVKMDKNVDKENVKTIILKLIDYLKIIKIIKKFELNEN